MTVELTEVELDLLRAGCASGGGPVVCSEEMAVAVGFRGLADFRAASARLRGVWPSTSLFRADWTRGLVATKIAFTSYVVGAAWDWRIATGFDDPESLQILRGLQPKRARARSFRQAPTRFRLQAESCPDRSPVVERLFETVSGSA